jgi:hypothetical protein
MNWKSVNSLLSGAVADGKAWSPDLRLRGSGATTETGKNRQITSRLPHNSVESERC